MGSQKKSLEFFISYSHKDMTIKEKLLETLAPVKKKYNVKVWHDGLINAGGDIDKEVLMHLSSADVVLLLISPSFLNSYYCMEKELTEAITRMNKNECVVVPVICRKCNLLDNQPFYSLSRVPKDGKPITSHKSHQEGCVAATSLIIDLIDNVFFNNLSSGASSKRIENSKSKNTTEKKQSKQKNSNINPSSKTTESTIQESTRKNTKGKSSPSISLYKNGKLTNISISQEFIDMIPKWSSALLEFSSMLEASLEARILRLDEQYKKTLGNVKKITASKKNQIQNMERDELRLFLMDICALVQEWITGSTGTRVHFRGAKDQYYVGIIASADQTNSVDVTTEWSTDLTPIPAMQGLIYYSTELKAPLLKSLNPKLNYECKNDTIWVEYMTYSFSNLTKGQDTVLSMAVSAKKKFYDTHRKDLFKYMTYVNIGAFVEGNLEKYIERCRDIDKNYNFEQIVKRF